MVSGLNSILPPFPTFFQGYHINSLNVHMLYWTSWPDNMGAVAVQLDKMIINA